MQRKVSIWVWIWTCICLLICCQINNLYCWNSRRDWKRMNALNRGQLQGLQRRCHLLCRLTLPDTKQMSVKKEGCFVFIKRWWTLSPIELRNKKRIFFSLSIPIFFCYNDAPGAIRIPGPYRGEQRHHKQRALQLHSCGPFRLPEGQTKTNINVGSLLQE